MRATCRLRVALSGPLVLLLLAAPDLSAAPPAQRMARQVDRLLAEEVFSDGVQLAPEADDATYLRRVWLDLVGDIPAPEEVTGFLLDPAEDKRRRVVRELLQREQFGQNWARYWRDVILLRRLEDRALLVSNPLVADLTKWLNENRGWDEIASQFITARGDIRENGATAVVAAQEGRTEETTAEIARIFLGIQIQCAQCHDHPYDRWRREEFHELAAFFPRIAVRPVLSPTRRSLEVAVDDGPRRRVRPNNNGNRGQPEHYMADLADPAARGTRMQPRFFLTSAELPFGTPDAARRGSLAEWITSNEWFAMAYVNRIWAELVGEGFYEPIDDLGPDRQASSPQAARVLRDGFIASGYDSKWLMRTICATEAYQRESRPRRSPAEVPFAANVPQRLRGDQLFNTILTVLEVDERDGAMRNLAGPQARAYGGRATPRMAFTIYFGYDPSDPRDGVAGSIPQALAMMNTSRINQAINGRTERTMLGRVLREIEDDESLVYELYLRCHAREPAAEELHASLSFVESVDNRREAFEDLLWALLNSAEFVHRR